MASDNGTGTPQDRGENVTVTEEDKDNGVAKAEKEAVEEVKDQAVEMEEENGAKEEKNGEEEVKGEEGDEKMMEDEGGLKGEKESGEEVEEEVGDVKMGEECDVKEEKETKEEVKEDAGSVNMEEEGDSKEEDKHGNVEEKTEENKEAKVLKKRRRGKRGEGKRKEAKVERGDVKAKGVDEEKGDEKKNEVDVEKGEMGKNKVDEGKGTTGKKKVVEDKGAVKKEVKDEKKGEAKKKVDGKKGDAKKVVNEDKAKELSTPVVFSLDRPVRERKSVERLVVALENEPVKEFLIQKGRGTPLKDIPNVAYKLWKKKSDETVKLLHAVIYGRRAKASLIKSNISQFSGFVWHENEEKQQAKIKERLDKYVKNKLMEFCDVLDIPITKATVRKEDLVSKIIDFLMAPHATTDVLLAEKDQSNNKRKRTINISTSKKSGSTSAKRSARKRRKIGDTPKSEEKSAPEVKDEDEEEEGGQNKNRIPDAEEDEPSEDSDSEKKEVKSEEKDEEDSAKTEHGLKKLSEKSSAGNVSVKKARTPKKVSLGAPTKCSVTTSSKPSKSKTDDTSDPSPKVFSRKKKIDDIPKKPSTPLITTPKEKTGKKLAKEKDKSKQKESSPSEEELRKTICEILQKVDFNTATFSDILKRLVRHFNTDLTPRKASIKLMMHEELTKLADEAEDDEDEESNDE